MNCRSRFLVFAICLLAVGLLSATAHADSYAYTFNGTADLTGGTETIAFQFVSSSPITSITTVTESQLNYCTNCQPTSLPVLTFVPSTLGDGLVFGDLVGVGSYLFSAGAFAAPGTYTSSGAGFDAGTLNVAKVSVPEPGVMQLGLSSAFMGLLALRRRRSARKDVLC